jgi:hypothetical protein
MGNIGLMMALAAVGTFEPGSPVAEQAQVVPAPDTEYAELARRYESAEQPSYEDLSGGYTGRCYGPELPDAAENALLAGYRYQVGQNNGPLFPPRFVTKAVHMVHQGYGADYFDSMSRDKEQQVRDWLATYHTTISEAVSSAGALISQNVGGNVEYRIRKSGSYFFEQTVLLNAYGSMPVGSVFKMCYYFRKVME